MNNNANDESSSNINKNYNFKEEYEYGNDSKINRDNFNFKKSKVIRRNNSFNKIFNENYL